VLTATRAMADYYELVVRESGADPRSPPTGWPWNCPALLNSENKEIGASRSRRADGRLLKRLADNTISGKIAKDGARGDVGRRGDADR